MGFQGFLATDIMVRRTQSDRYFSVTAESRDALAYFRLGPDVLRSLIIQARRELSAHDDERRLLEASDREVRPIGPPVPPSR